MDSEYSDEEVVENPTFKAAYNLEPLHHNQRLRWDHPVKLIGEKVFDPQIHLCEKCQYPILVYGRMLPCKHVFCLDCAKKYEKVCPRCDSRVVRIEQSALGTVFICTHGAPKHSINGCRRTYLSKRDLQAHIAHRHAVKPSSSSSGDRAGEEKLPSSTSQQHLISSTYDRESARERERDRDRERDRERERGDQVVYRPLDTSHPPPPPLGSAHLQQAAPGGIRSHPPALTIQHNPLRLNIGPLGGQNPPTTMESYMTAGLGGGGIVSVGAATRTNQNLITVPIQDEPDNYVTSRNVTNSAYASSPAVPTHSLAAPPPASYSTPPPHMGMPPPGVPGFPLGVGRGVPFSSTPLVQAVAHLASVTHALNQQRLAAASNPAQRLTLPPQGPPPTGPPPPVSTPSRFPQQQGFGSGGSPMQHWSTGGAPPPRQGQPPSGGGQRPLPSDGSSYRQYY